MVNEARPPEKRERTGEGGGGARQRDFGGQQEPLVNQQAVYLDSGHVSLRSMLVPRRSCGSALIRMLRAGICNTDLELQRGYYDFRGVPGDEFSGFVVESDNSALNGKRVVGEINLACGHCEYCAVGLSRHCLDRSVLGIIKHPGAFANYLTSPK